jgi:hypothetical protein
MKKKMPTKLLTALIFISMGSVSAHAEAIFAIRLTDSTTNNYITIYDNQEGDANSTLGVIGFSTPENGTNSLGSWTLDSSYALSPSWLTNPDGPYTIEMEMYSYTESSDKGKLIIEASVINLSSLANSWETTAEGFTSGSFGLKVLLDNDNQMFADGSCPIIVASYNYDSPPIGFITAPPVNGWGQTDEQYSLTIAASIEHKTAGFQNSSFTVYVTGDEGNAVPEPSLLLLFGIGLAGLEILRRKA